ncbi:MAG TPA: NAD-dependent epimerase/dehydratase family protein [Pirellulales bacterium]|jgi:nucleoside-diphosphate-sugar epimerase|nr:NAD-dependent epimerase/dehydratase family protein [Pirellulales bacterium]
MHALVTGANGFLGRYIVEQLLARGDRVRALVRSDSPELRSAGAEIAVADIRDRQATIAACAGIDVVFHVAGLSGIWGPWEAYYGVNVAGTENVLEGCRQHGIGRLVYTSSPSVTFDGRDQCGIDESAPYASRWLCHYPHTKAIAEQRVLAANAAAMHACALRPHLIWGPGDRHLVPRLLERARYGELRRVGSGKNLIDMIYVENAARAHLQAADALASNPGIAGRAYFISQGEPVNCWAWIDRLLGLGGLPPLRRSIPTGVAWYAGALLETYHRWFCPDEEPRMTRFLAAQLGRSHYFDIRRARDDFGYRAVVSTDEGMERLGRYLAK